MTGMVELTQPEREVAAPADRIEDQVVEAQGS